jgi:hypothetical protein
MTCAGRGAILRGIGASAGEPVPLHLRLPAGVLRGQLRGGGRPGVPHPGGPGCRRLQGSSQDPNPGVRTRETCKHHRVPTPHPPSSTRGKAGRNHLNEEIIPRVPTSPSTRGKAGRNHLNKEIIPRVPTSPSTRGKAGRNHLNEENTPLLPTGIGEQFSQTISNLEHAALLRRCKLPL